MDMNYNIIMKPCIQVINQDSLATLCELTACSYMLPASSLQDMESLINKICFLTMGNSQYRQTANNITFILKAVTSEHLKL